MGAILKQACQNGQRGFSGLHKNDLHGVFDDGEDHLWVVGGDVGEGDARVGDGKGIGLDWAKQLQ